MLPVFGDCHLLSATLSEHLRVVLDPRGYMGILGPTDRDVGELINWSKALADFWSEEKVGRLKPGPQLPELLLETMGSIFLNAKELEGAVSCIFKWPLVEGSL